MVTTPTRWPPKLRRALSHPPEVCHVENLALEDRRWRDHFHASPEYELIHVLKGRARIEYRGSAFDVAAGDTFVIPSGKQHRDVPLAGSAYRVFYVFFLWPAGRELLESGLRLTGDAPAGLKAHVGWLVRELEEECAAPDSGAEDRVHLALLEVILEMARYTRAPALDRGGAEEAVATRRRRAAARRAYEYLAAHYAEPVQLFSLAAAVGVTPFYVCRALSLECGASMTEILAARRIDAAKELLRNPDLLVKEIAARVGLPDAGYFAKVFRRYVGLSPTQYRCRVFGDEPRR